MTPAGKRLLTAWQDLEGDIQLGAYIAAIEAEASAAERARIAAAVRGLAKGPNPSRSRLLDPDAVLAVIEGGEKPDRSRPCAADPRCCRWLGHEGDHLYPDMGTT